MKSVRRRGLAGWLRAIGKWLDGERGRPAPVALTELAPEAEPSGVLRPTIRFPEGAAGVEERRDLIEALLA